MIRCSLMPDQPARPLAIGKDYDGAAAERNAARACCPSCEPTRLVKLGADPPQFHAESNAAQTIWRHTSRGEEVRKAPFKPMISVSACEAIEAQAQATSSSRR